VNVGSLSGLISVPFHGVYAASKHALAGYSDALRHEVRAFGVRVSLVEPAAHRTGITMVRPQRALAEYDAGRELVASIIQAQIAHGGPPSRVADIIVAAAISSTPRARYRVGFKASLASWALRLLPASLIEALVRYEFRLRPLLTAPPPRLQAKSCTESP
jgi:short-subunit dehydrogenase